MEKSLGVSPPKQAGFFKFLYLGNNRLRQSIHMGLQHAFLVATFVATCVGHCTSNGEGVLPMQWGSSLIPRCVV